MSAPPPQVTIECDRLAVRQIYTRVANGVYPPSDYILSAGPNGETTWVDPAALAQGDTGATGIQGPAGPTGDRGYQGLINEGYTGPQGPEGLRGYVGDLGPQGPQGPTGSVGSQGPQGSTGTLGPQGVQGFHGSQGPQGTTGATGPQGIQGPLPSPSINTYYWKYKTSWSWSTVVNNNRGYFTFISPSTLEFSFMDSNGIDRSNLFTSMYHIIDTSGYNAILQVVAASNPANQLVVYIEGGQDRIGTTQKTVNYSFILSGAATFTPEETYAMSVMYGGTSGPQGSTGSQGAQGPQGATGFQGAQGQTGPQGPTGPQGLGPQGPTGMTGPQGVQGYQGHTGSTGYTGPQGPVGPPNPLAPVNYTIRLYWDPTLNSNTGNYVLASSTLPPGLASGWTYNNTPSTPIFNIAGVRRPVIPNCITVFAKTTIIIATVPTTFWQAVSYNIGPGGAEIRCDPVGSTIQLINFTQNKLSAGGSAIKWTTASDSVYINLTYFL